MRYIVFLFCIFPLVTFANNLTLDDALRATYVACVGIDDELTDLKKMAGINTAITAVGTAAGAGATVTGLVKADKDKQIEKLQMQKLQKIEESKINTVLSNGKLADNLAALERYYQEHKNDAHEDIDTEIDKLTYQSKKLGNWRTGLVAGTTATNVAGAIIAGKNKVQGDLKAQIDNCISSVANLRHSMMQARINGEDVSEAEAIASACGEYEYVDISKINTKAKGAMISSAVGATTGLAGTVVSAAANTDKTRNNDSVSGKQKEKNLNTAANVLAAGTTAASATATVFNASQISAVKKAVAVAEQCTKVLK